MKNRFDLMRLPDEQLRSKLVEMMSDERNYLDLDADGGWSIADAIRSNDKIGWMILNILNGTELDGSRAPDGDEPPIPMIRLKVLTRQACNADKDGKPINCSDAKKFFAHDNYNEAMPSIDTPPKQGDFVLVKASFRTKDEAGKDMIPSVAAAFEARHLHEPYRWRNGMKHRYAEYKVDAFGCINVKPSHAIALLRSKGKEIVFPVHANEAHPAKNSDGKVKRVISNWWFEEVAQAEELERLEPVSAPPPVEAPARRGRKVKTEQPESVEVPVETIEE